MRFDAKAPGWQFVTGRPDDIKAINAKFGDRSADRSLSSHRNEVLIGNDTTGDWQRDWSFGDVDELVMTIRLMDPGFRDQAGAGRQADRGRLRLLSAQRQAGPGAVQQALRTMPHGRWRSPRRPRSSGGRRPEGPRLADRVHHQPAGNAGAARSDGGRTRRQLSGRSDAGDGAWRNRRGGSGHLPAGPDVPAAGEREDQRRRHSFANRKSR